MTQKAYTQGSLSVSMGISVIPASAVQKETGKMRAWMHRGKRFIHTALTIAGKKYIWRYEKLKPMEESKADKLARVSFILGIISLACLPLILIESIGSVFFLASVPLAIIAIVMGLRSKRLGSTNRNGVSFGIITLVLLALAILALILIIAGIFSLLGG